MKVLIVSNNVISLSSGMGKTLLSYFSCFSPNEVAQFYIGAEIPTLRTPCAHYYRFTDRDALRARFPGVANGRSFCEKDISENCAIARNDTGVESSLHRFGRQRTPLIYAARNLMWKTAFWKTNQLKKWVHAFAPDVIFFASGDYSFMYDIANWFAEETGKPLVISCVDDFFCNNRNQGKCFGAMVHASFLNTVKRTMARASCVLTICDAMAEAYSAAFDIPCHTLHTGAAPRENDLSLSSTNLSYLGNLGHRRSEGLIEMGRALRQLSLQGGPQYIDVYSAEERPEILREMTEENGIRFHGMISADEVAHVMRKSMAVIHVESFDPQEMARVRLSVSTKIADSLMNGPCLVAFGPKGIASIDYLQISGAACVITSPADLLPGLRKVLSDAAYRSETVARARELAMKNHDASKVSGQIRSWLEGVTAT